MEKWKRDSEKFRKAWAKKNLTVEEIRNWSFETAQKCYKAKKKFEQTKKEVI